MSTRRRIPTEAEKANALVEWFSEALGEGFEVERPADAARWSDARIWRYYVRHRQQRSVIWVASEFLKFRDVGDFSTSLLASPPTVVDLIRAGAPYIAVARTGRAHEQIATPAWHRVG